jgi:hypothetical protein
MYFGPLAACRKEKVAITTTTLPDAYAVFGKKIYETSERLFSPDQRVVIQPLSKQLDALLVTFAQQTNTRQTVDPSKPASEWADGNTMAKATESQIRKKYSQLGKLAFNEGIHPANCENECFTVRALTNRLAELDRQIANHQRRRSVQTKSRADSQNVLGKVTAQSVELSEKAVDVGSAFIFSSPVICTLAVLFPPLGLFLIWKHPTWGKFSKIRWASISAVCLLSLLMIGTTKKIVGNAIHLADFTVRSAGSALYDIAADNGIIVRPEDKPVWLAGSATPWKYEPIIDFSDAESEQQSNPVPAPSANTASLPQSPEPVKPTPPKPKTRTSAPSGNQNVYTVGFEPNGPFDPSIGLGGFKKLWGRAVDLSMNEHHTGTRSLRLSANFVGPEKVKWLEAYVSQALPPEALSFLVLGSKISFFLKGRQSEKYHLFVNLVDANGEHFGVGQTDVPGQWNRREFRIERGAFIANWGGDNVLDFPLKEISFGLKGDGNAVAYIDDVTFTKPTNISEKASTQTKVFPNLSLIQKNSLTGWAAADQQQPFKWQVRDSVLTSRGGGADIVSEKSFEDFDFHCEFKLSPRSNSGIYFRGQYEIQLLDSLWRGRNGAKANPEQTLGAVYGQKGPRGDAYYGPDSWNVLDARLEGQQLSIKLNGVQIINNYRLVKPTQGSKPGQDASFGPILIQAVKEGTASFRNMRVTPLRTPGKSAASQTVEVLPLLDIGRATKQGRWSRDDRGLLSLAGKLGNRSPKNRQIALPIKPDRSYQLRFTAERLEAGLGINIGLVIGGRRALLVIDGSGSHKACLEDINGHSIHDAANPTVYKGSLLPLSQPREVVCKVANNSVTVTCGGRQIINWSGDPKNLTVPEMWELPGGGLSLGGQQRFRFSEVRYTPLGT